MGVRDLKGMFLLTVGTDVGIAQRPLHAVIPNRSVADHRHLRNVLAYLEIVFQLEGLHGIVGNGSLRTEQPVMIIVRLLAVIQITSSQSRHVAHRTDRPFYLGNFISAKAYTLRLCIGLTEFTSPVYRFFVYFCI